MPSRATRRGRPAFFVYGGRTNEEDLMNTGNASPLGNRIVRTAASTLIVAALLASAGCSVVTRDQGTESSSSTRYGYETPPVQDGAKSSSGAAVAPDSASVSVGAPEALTSAEVRGSADSAAAEKQLMIRTANMRVQVKDVDAAVSRLRALTAEFGGLVEALQVSSQQEVPIYRPTVVGVTSDAAPLAAYATVRVPQAKFDAFVARVVSLGKVLTQSESGTDVTQQHIDLTARLTTLRAEEARLREFLKAAKTVQDMLAVESELSRVRGEIESMQGQLDYLDKQIAMSALTVELVRPTPVVQPAGTDWGFADALRNGIRGAAALVAGMITVLIGLLPLVVLIAVVSGIIIAIVRARRRRAGNVGSESESAVEAGTEVTPSTAPVEGIVASAEAEDDVQ